VAAAGRLPWPVGTDLLAAARAAFTHGMNNAALGAAIATVAAAVLSAVFFRGVRVAAPAAQAKETQPQDGKELAA
jgi:DHA2 family multidrug resistance protein-like MFS transporter